MSKLALGTVQIGLPYGIANQTGQVDLSSARDMLRFAKASGIRCLDTAIHYGESEAVLGQIGCENFDIVTKLPEIPDGVDVNEWLEAQINGSLIRLKRDSVYAVMLHRPEQLHSNAGDAIYAALQNLKETGKAEKIGVSTYSYPEIDSILEKYQIDIVQTPFNLIDQSLVTSGCLRRLKDQHVEVHVRSVFLQGLLLLPLASVPEKFAPWMPIFDHWTNWLSERRLSPVEAALSFVHGISDIDKVVVGADSLAQLEEMVSACSSHRIIADYCDIKSDSELLTNPSKWSQL